ncbi:MAG TPA: methyltransferase domain-containing protein [Bryobacteraceae bacterium]|nr:methyltransferase domain-containing protein [Bryobacteraceae bacterium]
MSERAEDVSKQMREDWNRRAREDAHYYVAFGGRDQDEAEFDATAADVLKNLEAELKRLAANANRRAWRALEIGCGPGRLMKPLSRHFGEIHGVDVSDEMIALARERLRGIPHAHVHATSGASLAQFADESFDFVYTFAVFQHIPSREVVLEYMREIRRVLKPGGIFRGQFNGLEKRGSSPTTWSGVTFSADDIHGFTREKGFELLALDGVATQYMWTTWRKPGGSLPTPQLRPPRIHRITHAYTREPAVPNRGRHTAIAVSLENLPAECDLNSLEVLVEGVAAAPCYIGPPGSDRLQQINAWLPKQIRTGLLPLELRYQGQPLGQPAILRVIPAGPMVPRIISITDGVNLVQHNLISTGHVKVQLEEVSEPESITAKVDGRPIPHVEVLCIDPRPPRYEVNLRLPWLLPAGQHVLQLQVGPRRLLPARIETRS